MACVQSPCLTSGDFVDSCPSRGQVVRAMLTAALAGTGSASWLVLSQLQGSGGAFDFGRDYAWQEELYGLGGRPPNAILADGAALGRPENGDCGGDGGRDRHFGPQWVYMRLGQPVTAPEVRRDAAVS